MNQNLLLRTACCTQNIIRYYARKAILKTKTANPGIQKRLNIFNENEESALQDIDVDELESDFMNLSDIHRKHEDELKYYKEKEKYWIVKRKYFKENKVNFLTWNDKEQIRHLHQSNPTEWTIEKLSEGFPALPGTIKKILKNKWQTKNESKKKNHDQAVIKNWDLFKKGKLSEVLPLDLVNHLTHFSARKLNAETDLMADKTVIKEFNFQNKNNEFSSIISSYEKLKQKVDVNRKIVDYCQTNENNSIQNNFTLFGNKDVTLTVLKEHCITNQVENTETLVPNYDVKIKFPKKIETNNKSVDVTSKNNLNVVNYPEKIKIPKDKYKKGFTYKVNDCYYDDDGEFLYRIPGMF